jgi:lipid II:glycine glycyltransferase (peptidoglycan interpeptide bridge formation enzyme)
MQLIHNSLQKSEWDAFVLKHGPRSGLFLQSWNWGEFQKDAGEKVDRVVWMVNGDLRAVAQVIHKNISGFGSYAYIPRGPITLPLPSSRGEHERGATFPLSDMNTEENMFVRFEPASEGQAQGLPPRTQNVSDIQPAHTLITDLSQTEEQLLSGMHEKTRYNIRLAEKKGVQIEIKAASIDDVWHVFEMTSSRDEFRLHGKEYYRKMIESGVAFLAIAKQEDDILAANIMMDFGGVRTYLHGASSNVKRNFMGPYLLHWELMKNAKANGIQSYDWWGVAPVDALSTHPWAGISRFKRGFGGEEVEYPGTFDVVIHPIKYQLYQFVRMIRRRMK